MLRLLGRVLFWTAGPLLLVGGILHYFYVERIQITHNAMAPTLLMGEVALLWKGAKLELGDIAVCEHPGHQGEWVIGRVAALPGMTIGTDPRGRLLIDGQPVERDFQGKVRFYDPVFDRTDTMLTGVVRYKNVEHPFFLREDLKPRVRQRQVAQGLFLLSDNLTYPGFDSRTFGEVDPAKCRGQVFMRMKPADDHGAGLGHGWFDLLL